MCIAQGAESSGGQGMECRQAGEGPSSCRLDSDTALQGSPCQGSTVTLQRPLSFGKKLNLVNDTTSYAGCVTSKHPALAVQTGSPWVGNAGKGIFVSGVRKGLHASEQMLDLCGSFVSRVPRQRKTHAQGYQGRSRNPNIADGRRAAAGRRK